jgi:hypothetical protein
MRIIPHAFLVAPGSCLFDLLVCIMLQESELREGLDEQEEDSDDEVLEQFVSHMHTHTHTYTYSNDEVLVQFVPCTHTHMHKHMLK